MSKSSDGGRDRLVGRQLFEAFPDQLQNAKVLRASLQRVFDSSKPDVIPLLRYPVPNADESGSNDRYWSCSNIPIKSQTGEVVYVLQNTQDVTDIHRSSHAGTEGLRVEKLGTAVLDRAERLQAMNLSLLAESTQLRNLFMRAPSFMCLLRGPEYRIELANLAFMDLVGQRQLTGRTFREAVPEVDGQLYLDMLDEVFRTGEPFVGKQMRAEFERQPGRGPEEVFISFVFQPIVSEDGNVLAIFVDGNDVTDHVRAERSQALLVRELHHRVRNTLATVAGV